MGQAPPRIIGHFDGVDAAQAYGWAADLDAPSTALDIEFFRVEPDGDAIALGRTVADRPREDLRSVGLDETSHGFAWEMPRSATDWLLSARVADHDFELPGSPVAVTRTETAPRIIGQLDAVDGSRASGWAADLNDPERVLEIEFFDISPTGPPRPLGRARANRPRHDLRSAGLETIRHGFDWRIPFACAGSRLDARVVGHDFELPGSPAEVVVRPVFEGSFDGITLGVLRGWAWAWDPAIEVSIEVSVDGQLRGTALARTDRPDLAVAGIGDGRHGFAWVVPDDLVDGVAHEFACRIAGTAEWLAGSPQTAVITPGSRLPEVARHSEVRGVARRPQPMGTAATRLHRAAGGRHAVRLLVPIWGDEYIAPFCRTVLPGFLSTNNLPFLTERHDLTVTFLTRASEREQFNDAPAYQRLRGLAGVEFLPIDDILAACFDAAPASYATALTYAFHRGIRAVGDAALATDFVFWNADFVAADGLFRTLSQLISADVRCTFAPSLRVEAAAEAAIPPGRRSADGSILEMGSREWVALAMRFLHSTVKAQTVNRFEVRMIDTVNQLYWQVDDRLMVARVFLMFMLHIRPERLWDKVYGHCDYVFVPEMVPSGDYHFETDSARMLIVELQHHNREWQEIVYGDRAMTPAEVARGAARWTTREHRLASRQLVVFNAGDERRDLAETRRTIDQFMDEVYRLMPADPVWHNGHLFWTDSLAALGLDYAEPGPDHPRSHLAAALRFTGYDIDVLRESWPDPAGPPAGMFDLTLPLDREFDIAPWLEDVRSRYLRAWRETAGAPKGLPQLDLVSGHFHGFGWGVVKPRPGGWVRQLGPEGCATLLLVVPPKRGLRLQLSRPDDSRAARRRLNVTVNGCAVPALAARRDSGVCVDIAEDLVKAADGRLEITLSADMPGGDAFIAIELASQPVVARIDNARVAARGRR